MVSRPGGAGRGESSGTRPSVEFYRGEIWVKMPFLPKKRTGFTPKIIPTSSGELGTNLGRVIVSNRFVTANAVSSWSRPTPAPTRRPEFKPSLLFSDFEVKSWVPGRAKRIVVISLLLHVLIDTFYTTPKNPSSEQKSPVGVFREYWCFKSRCRGGSHSM